MRDHLTVRGRRASNPTVVLAVTGITVVAAVLLYVALTVAFPGVFQGTPQSNLTVTIPVAATSGNPYCVWLNHSADIAQFCLYVVVTTPGATPSQTVWSLGGTYDPPVSGTPYTCTTTSPTAYPNPCGNAIHFATVSAACTGSCPNSAATWKWQSPDGLAMINYFGGYGALLSVQ